MTFRYARHTNDLARLTQFYVEVIGLDKLGEFNDHSGYNGVFLGFPGSDWHIEFTESSDEAKHTPDEDDLLVFYANNKREFDEIITRVEERQIPQKKSKNPYWAQHGIEITDPDGFGVIITLKK